MKRILLLAALGLLGAAPLAAQPLSFDLAVAAGGSSADNGEGVAIAPDGSYYVAGTFEGTATFGDLTLTSAGNSDAFLVKYDADGTALWARRSGTNQFWDYGRDVAVDAQGNVYYSGNFTGIATWDGGENPDIELTTRNDWDGFVAKYTADGDLQWVQQLGGGGQDAANVVTVGPDGTVYVGGGFVGPGIFGDVTLPGAGGEDGFVAALAPADGDVLWAVSAGGTDGDTVYGVDLDAQGNVYVAGQYRGVADIFGTPFQSNGFTDIFVAMLSDEGDGVWAVDFGGAGSDYARGFGVSPAGHAVVTGSFEESVLVGQDILNSAGASDVLVAAVNPDGSLAWGRRGGGTGFDFSEDATVDAAGNAYVTGYVVDSGTFGEVPYTTTGFDDIFLAVFDIEGELLHLELAGGTNRDQGKGIDVAGGRFAMTGYFRGTGTFGDFEFTGPGSLDVFLAAGEALEVETADPVAVVTPEALALEVTAGSTASATLTLANTAPAGSAALTFTATAARPDTVVVDFEDGQIPYSLTLGNPGHYVEADGGHPGRWLRNDQLATFAPSLYLPATPDSPFAGDLVARRVTSISVDAQTLAAPFGVAERPFSLKVTRFNGQPDNPEAHDYVYLTGPEVPQPGAGWQHYDFPIPWDFAGPLPEGWGGGYYEDPESLPPGVVWQDVVREADLVELMWGHPAYFYLLQDFDLGVDNLTVTFSAAAEAVAVAPESGAVAPGESQALTVTVDAAALEPGAYAFEVVISTNDPAAPTLTVPVTVTVLPRVSTEDGTEPARSRLAAAYPNPFSTSTTLALELSEAQDVTVAVYDALGRRLAVLHEGPLSVGQHRMVFEAAELPAGVYIVRADGAAFRQIQRVTLVR